VLWLSKLDSVLHGDVYFHRTNDVEVMIVIPVQTEWLKSSCLVADMRVVECMWAYVIVGLSLWKLETLQQGNVDFSLTNEVEVLIVIVD
jgi:hypothetical protein